MMLFLYVAAVGLYALSFLCYARILYAPQVALGRLASVLLCLGIIVQYLELLARAKAANSIPYDDLYGSMSLFAWLLGVTYLGLELFHRERSVGAFVTLGLVVWMVVLRFFATPALPNPELPRGSLFAFHVTLNTWSYAAFALSFILSVIYLIQDRMLRSRRMATPSWRFPALDVLDRMARSSVYIGLIALALGVAMGLDYAWHETGARVLYDPKVVVTAFILVAYVVYLRVSRISSWRGPRAALLCAFNFALVLFSYTFVNLYLTKFHHFY
ncbi:MAG TPA: cytochrome c biogenesis protein CcsA [Candidatus Acidoferrum sp.]|nr:cytochrome c biogenesis protein CcsA [Candidatus Acidoferrum sp.]